MRPRFSKFISPQTVCLLLTSSSIWAQTTATVVGTVTDASGAVAPRVSITVSSAATGLSRKTATNQTGNYIVPALPVGEYSITAEAAGFKRKTVTSVVLEVNQEPRVDIQLEVGAVTESVTVSVQAIQLQTENATVGQVVDNLYTTQIPLNGRDFSNLAFSRQQNPSIASRAKCLSNLFVPLCLRGESQVSTILHGQGTRATGVNPPLPPSPRPC